MRGVHYLACSLCYKKIAQFHQKCPLMRDCSLFRRLLLPEYTVIDTKLHQFSKFILILSFPLFICAWFLQFSSLKYRVWWTGFFPSCLVTCIQPSKYLYSALGVTIQNDRKIAHGTDIRKWRHYFCIHLQLILQFSSLKYRVWWTGFFP